MAKKAFEYSILVYVCAFHIMDMLEGWEVSHAYRVNSTISSTQKIPLDGPPLCVSATTSFTDWLHTSQYPKQRISKRNRRRPLVAIKILHSKKYLLCCTPTETRCIKAYFCSQHIPLSYHMREAVLFCNVCTAKILQIPFRHSAVKVLCPFFPPNCIHTDLLLHTFQKKSCIF